MSASRARCVLRLLRPTLPDCSLQAEIVILPKTDPRGWIAGHEVRCCARFGTRTLRDFVLRPDIASVLVRCKGRTLAMVVVMMGEDKTLLANSLQLSRDAVRLLGGAATIDTLLRRFLRGLADRHGLRACHTGGSSFNPFEPWKQGPYVPAVKPRMGWPWYCDLHTQHRLW